MAEQTKLFLWNNQNLFSNNYLEHHLPTTSLWKAQKEKVSDIFDAIIEVRYLLIQQAGKFRRHWKGISMRAYPCWHH